jgi:uncharacterized protein (DUF305 family)
VSTHNDEDVVLADMVDEDNDRPGPSRQRIVIFSAAALAVLLVGAAIGMLITLATVGKTDVPDANSVDVGFTQDMSTHHLQAVTMASFVRDHTADIEVKTLAFDIESTQKTQVGMFAGMLQLWDQPESRPPDRQAMSWMAASGGMHDMGGMQMQGMAPTQLMPGMATQAEIAKLRSLSGKDLDVYFLQLMIRHHTGGLTMAQYGEAHAATPPLRNLAHTIVVGQTSEVAYMKNMLNARGAQPLPNS